MGFFINTSSSDNITDEDRENLKKLDDVAEKMKDLDEGLEKINNTTDEINNLKDNKADVNHTHQYTDIENAPNLEDYALKDYVTQEIEKVETIKGDKGDTGDKGQDGLSAYEIAKNKGFVGDESQWLESLKGDKGDTGKTGEKGEKGEDGTFNIEATYTKLETTDKTVLGAINEVFTSASNGKKLIAQAITGKGVETSESDTFSTMAQNINNIPSGSGGDITQNELEFLNCMKSRTELAHLFRGYSGTEIKGMIDTSNVTNMSYMFTYCSNLTTIPSLNTSSVTNMSNMFAYCSKLSTIPSLNTSNVTNMSYMFSYCSNLTTVTMLDTSSVTNMNYIFNCCSNLTTIKFNPEAKKIVKFDISHCTKMAAEDLMGMIESLPTTTSSVTITVGSTLSNKLSEEAWDMVLAKGYTVV